MSGSLSSVRYLDSFMLAQYELDYRSEGGSLSTWLKLEYHDGAVIDFNLGDIVGYGMSQESAEAAQAECYVGQADRLFPTSINSATAPRLWEAKQAALKVMDEYNVGFILATLPAVIFVITIGIGVNFRAGASKVTRRPLGPRRIPAKPAKNTGSSNPLTNSELGKIIKWGEGGSAAGVNATVARTRSLTPAAVKEMIDSGLNRVSVDTLVKVYETALANPIKAAANPQLAPRLELMRTIIELWPK